MAALKEMVRLASRIVAIGVLDFLSISRVAPLGWILRAIRSRQLSVIGAEFDPDFYLRQIRSSRRRRRARLDPLVHYIVVGWREHRSPNRRFDPRYYQQDVCRGIISSNPFWHFLSNARAGAPQNEVEAASPRVVGPVAKNLPKALVFHHARGGGSSQFLALFETDLRAHGFEPVRLRLVPQSDRLVVWTDTTREHRVFDMLAEPDELIKHCHAHDVRKIIISHLIDFHPETPTRIQRLSLALRAPIWLILHDYFSLCSRVNLVDHLGRACPIRPVADCVRCVSTGDSEVGSADVATLRSRMLRFAAEAGRVIVPSESMRTIMSPYLDRHIEVWAPETDAVHPPLRPRRILKQSPLSIVVVGSLNVAKGSQTVLDLGRFISDHRAQMRLTVIGEAINTRQLLREGVEVTGRYRSEELGGLIQQSNPDVVFFPAIWPETWSFVLSAVLDKGLPVVAFDHGAPADRLRKMGRGDLLMPVDFVGEPTKIFNFFRRLRATWDETESVSRHSHTIEDKALR